jgi:signal transduction histidine kinase
MVLSVMLGTITYSTVRRVVLENREESAIDQVARDALLVETVGPGSTNPSELLASIRPASRSTPFLFADGRWFAASLQVRPEDLPQRLISTVTAGDSARQYLVIDASPVLVIGTPLNDDLGAYFEVFQLRDIQSTLTTLQSVLVAAGIGTTLVGGTLGWFIAGRVLRPLREVTAVAQQIASGQLETRLDEGLDRDLLTLTSSFNSMADTLQKRIAREARFASDVAHELRTPVTTLVTSLSVLSGRRSELSPEGGEALDLLASDVRRLEHTVEDLIEMAKHDAGIITPDMELLPAASVLGGIMNRLRRQEIPIDIDEEATRSMIWIDQRRLERVLANLIDNADAYGMGVTRVSAEGGDGTMRIAVEDKGPGVPDGQRERIFERFARGNDSHRSGEYAGSGLGLSLAVEDVRVFGGRIWVEDGPAGGARFVVEVRVEK